jgi:hypothetical protein
MGRSQRHMLWEQGETAAGEIHAQGVVAPGIAMQVDPQALNVLKPGPGLLNNGLEWREPREVDGVEVPVGPPGGPLAGSTLTGAIPESLDAGGGEGPPNPEPGMEPTLTSIDPTTAELNSADFTLRCLGTNFTETSVIMFAGQPEPIVFVSAEEITTIVKPSLPWGPATLPVAVKQGAYITEPIDFTFTEAAMEGRRGGRAFPIGPASIISVEDHADGIQLTLSEAVDVQGGDTVLIEATGNTGVNGSYPVLSSDGTVIVVGNPLELATPIESKGRLTVTG